MRRIVDHSHPYYIPDEESFETFKADLTDILKNWGPDMNYFLTGSSDNHVVEKLEQKGWPTMWIRANFKALIKRAGFVYRPCVKRDGKPTKRCSFIDTEPTSVRISYRHTKEVGDFMKFMKSHRAYNDFKIELQRQGEFRKPGFVFYGLKQVDYMSVIDRPNDKFKRLNELWKKELKNA